MTKTEMNKKWKSHRKAVSNAVEALEKAAEKLHEAYEAEYAFHVSAGPDSSAVFETAVWYEGKLQYSNAEEYSNDQADADGVARPLEVLHGPQD